MAIFGHFPRTRSTDQVVALFAALLVLVGFVIYTNEIWGDFLITYRHSENLIRGNGLVFSPGERVHGFTSPLNTLVPAAIGWVTQARDFAIPLIGFRVVSLVGAMVALVALLNLLTTESDSTGGQRWLALAFPLLAVLEIKTTAFTMNGQEAGLMLGFLAPVFVLAYRGWPRSHATVGGICLAGLMYSRPDAFVHAAAAVAAGLAFATEARKEFVRSFARSALIGFLLYLPWMAFAQFYYGSPIPHTVIAKRGMETFQTFGLQVFAPVAAALANLPTRLGDVLGGIYDFRSSEPGNWPAWVRDLAFGLELVAVTYWLLPTRDRLGRVASLCTCLLLAYLALASVFAFSCPWYYPTVACLSIFTLVRIAVADRDGAWARPIAVATLFTSTALVVLLAFVFFYSARALKLKQEATDWNHRRLVGLWLRENVRPEQTIFLEPLGYIGYFSQRKIHDWPGLVSPTVVAIRKKIGRPPYPWAPYYWGKVAEELKPDWIVARPTEVDQMNASPALKRDYQLVKVFNASEPIIATGVFYGTAVTFNDAVFEIFRRRPAPPAR